MMPVTASENGAYNVHVTKKYVMATAKCSCDLSTDYNYHTRVFYNYDPSSNTWGTLAFEEGPYYGPNDGTSPEGLWYSTITDMDFCCVHGKSHDNRDVFLIPYNGVINGKIVKNGYFTGIKTNSTSSKKEQVQPSQKTLFFNSLIEWNPFSI